ncbi:uncharacterized protein HLK63_J11099 [Nakaseomyces glabratus]|nr:hypothetical protein B1J91_J11264g [Nakaseomyces glabratus]OXB47653.1 hypothetical protein B1J92_J11264g [Nakaseomyces glabratus]UCS21999.1 uncharacterized protein GW608_J11099 [Nakaseomyces glabratus]UCS27231.1 uncharacterized protein HLK63_J11099 [Nakaseomyces glabratus]UCS32460.1 uncharacterized protein HLK64_J11099 [Nakaseomyces glabratus]
MPLNIIGTALLDGTDKIPYFQEIKKVAPYALAGAAVKYWSRGPSNNWERKLHGKVYIVTGATSQGMGTSVVLEMARLGAQLIILCRDVDEWTTDWCEDLRERTQNELIFVEQCDLSDLYQVRKFATTWLDNSPPRRLDGVVALSGDMEPWGIPMLSRPIRRSSKDGLEIQMAVNFVGLFHLLDILQPSFKAQPPDRDVRIIVSTCWLQSLGDIKLDDPLWQDVKYQSALKFFASSKLQLGLCLAELQRKVVEDVQSQKKAEKSGKNVTVTLVQPGTMRSTSMRRVISNGSVFLLLFLYCVVLYPFLWFFTKSGNRGAQTVLYALMTPELEEVNLKDTEIKYISDCRLVKFARKEYQDKALQQNIYNKTKDAIFELEKKSAVKRNAAEKSNNKDKKNTKSASKAKKSKKA